MAKRKQDINGDWLPGCSATCPVCSNEQDFNTHREMKSTWRQWLKRAKAFIKRESDEQEPRGKMLPERQDRNQAHSDAITAYLSEPYARILYPDPYGQGWIATIAEFRGCVAGGGTPAAAIEGLDCMVALWIRDRIDNGEPIPRPSCIQFMRTMGHFD